VSEQDINEIESICPSLSQILRLCDMAKDVQCVTLGLTQSLGRIQQDLDQKQAEFEYNLQMDEVGFHVSRLKNFATDLAQSKRQALFEEGTLTWQFYEQLQREQ